MSADSFNLNPPPGFRGLDPNVPVHVYHRRLPHWRQAGATYFVTFRLADAIPQNRLRALKRWRQQWERAHPEPRSEKDWERLAREISRKTEAWLDEGYGQCVFRQLDLAEVMSNSLLHFQNDRYQTSCFTVMPNHVHLVMRPLGEHRLEKILESSKGFTSRKLNARLGQSGELWEPESFDRIIRDEEHLFRVIQYIGRNPGRAGISRRQWVRWVHPDWEKAGWGFRDG